MDFNRKNSGAQKTGGGAPSKGGVDVSTLYKRVKIVEDMMHEHSTKERMKDLLHMLAVERNGIKLCDAVKELRAEDGSLTENDVFGLARKLQREGKVWVEDSQDNLLLKRVIPLSEQQRLELVYGIVKSKDRVYWHEILFKTNFDESVVKQTTEILILNGSIEKVRDHRLPHPYLRDRKKQGD